MVDKVKAVTLDNTILVDEQDRIAKEILDEIVSKHVKITGTPCKRQDVYQILINCIFWSSLQHSSEDAEGYLKFMDNKNDKQ